MIIFILLMTISIIMGCNNTTEHSKVEIKKIVDYSYLEKYNESISFKVKESFYIISELVSAVDSLNNRQSKLKEIHFVKDSVKEKSELIFLNKKMKAIIDSIQVNQLIERPIELRGKSLIKTPKDTFFHQEYLIPLNRERNIVARVYGIDGKSKIQFESKQNFFQEFDIPDGANYFIRVMDLNGDNINEILLYSAPIYRVDLKIFQVKM